MTNLEKPTQVLHKYKGPMAWRVNANVNPGPEWGEWKVINGVPAFLAWTQNGNGLATPVGTILVAQGYIETKRKLISQAYSEDDFAGSFEMDSARGMQQCR